MRSCARSLLGSRERTAASNSPPPHSCLFARAPRMTCAFVTMRPSPGQRIPEPAPWPPDSMRTVERRSCSAISPNPGIAMLISPQRTLTDSDVSFPRRAAAHKFDRQRLADHFAGDLGVHIFESRDWVAADRDKNIANHESRLLRGAIGLDFDHDGGGLLRPLQRLAKRFGNSDGMQPNAQVTLRNAPFLQQRIDNPVHSRRGNSDGAEAGKSWRGEADHMARRINDSTAYRGRLQTHIEPDVRCQGRACPGAPLRGNQADSAESSDRAAGTRSPNDQNEAAWLDSRGV